MTFKVAPAIPKHWVPIPVVGLYQEWFEFVPYRNQDV